MVEDFEPFGKLGDRLSLSRANVVDQGDKYFRILLSRMLVLEIQAKVGNKERLERKRKQEKA